MSDERPWLVRVSSFDCIIAEYEGLVTWDEMAARSSSCRKWRMYVIRFLHAVLPVEADPDFYAERS